MPGLRGEGILVFFLRNIKVSRHAWFTCNLLVISIEIMISQEIAISTKIVIFAKPAILVISTETIEICYFGVKRTMPRPGRWN